MSDFLDFVADCWVSLLLGGLLMAVLVAVMVLAGIGEMQARAKFMEQCQQDHKEYECTALWRSGDPSVVAVPVVIPMR